MVLGPVPIIRGDDPPFYIGDQVKELSSLQINPILNTIPGRRRRTTTTYYY